MSRNVCVILGISLDMNREDLKETFLKTVTS